MSSQIDTQNKSEKEKEGDYSVFQKRQNSNNNNFSFSGHNINMQSASENIKDSMGNIFGKFKTYIKLPNDEEANIQQEEIEKNKTFCNKIFDYISDSLEVEKSYKFFFIFFSVGIGIIFFSLLFLPIVVLAPTKFVSLFSLGSLVTLISFIFIYGTKEYFGMLFSKERYLFSLLFIFSTLINLYFAIFNPYFIVSLICAGIQFIILLIFGLSFIPGGSTGISFILSMVLSPFKKLISRFTG